MVLKKFVSIKSIGRFHDSKAAGDVELRKLTLLYGENGRGKTTLCAILRSLESGDAAYITGRQTLGATGTASVRILIDAVPPFTSFTDGVWNQVLPALRIFDQHYISENVYLGDGVGPEQKRNLYKIIVGKDAVAQAQRMDQLVADIRKTSASIRDASKAIESHLVPGLKLPTLLSAQLDPEIDNKITTLEATVLNGSATIIIQKSTPFELVSLPPKPAGLLECLSTTIESISHSAEGIFKAHLAKHRMAHDAQGWIAQGLEYAPEAGCPFCGQSLIDIDLVEAYKVIFSESYRNLKERIANLGKSVAEAFASAKLRTALRPLEDRVQSAEFWKPLAAFTPPDGPHFADTCRIVDEYREQILRVLRLKHQAPLEPLVLDDAAVGAETEYDRLIDLIRSFNMSAAVANEQVKAKQAQIQLADPNKTKAEIEILRVLKKRHEPRLNGLCENLATLNALKEEQEKERDEIKNNLDRESGAVVAKYQSSINRYLDLFNAGFAIAEVDHNYVGGVSASYQLLINRVPVRLGDDRTPLDKPSFKNTLSAGDKSTLALALFLSQLDNDNSRRECVVVLDDPFNSQDSFRRNQTAIEITRLVPNVAQVIVLSHDARFLKEMADKAIGLEVKTLKLNPVGESTEICELNLDEMLRSEIRILVDILQTYYSSSGGEARNVVQKIRPLLEAYCRNSCITLFEPDDILSGILTKIRTTGATHPLHAIYQELSDINDFTCRHHHADGTVSGVISETELRGYVKRGLRAVGAISA